MHPGFLALSLFATAATSAVVQGPERVSSLETIAVAAPSRSVPAILVTDVRIQMAIDRLDRKSRLWREALGRVAALERRILIMTPDRVVVEESTGAMVAFDGSTIAEVSPVRDADGAVNAVMVVLNVALLDSLHTRLGSRPGEFEADLERVLAHEVYGHAIPYLIAGSLDGRCPDPVPGQSARDACSIRRENEVRREADLGQRSDYELEGLALGRRLASAAPVRR